jgi:hypothetical protein
MALKLTNGLIEKSSIYFVESIIIQLYTRKKEIKYSYLFEHFNFVHFFDNSKHFLHAAVRFIINGNQKDIFYNKIRIAIS